MALLGELTTLGVGGPARELISITDEFALRQALANPPFLLLGGGSNLVVHDSGWPGTVGHMAIPRQAHFTAGTRVLVRVGAGEDWDSFVRFCAERGWGGVECLAGIPGTVGATPVQNVGAYGQEVADTLQELKALDRTTGEVLRLSAAECEFAYRKSRFNSGELNRWIVLSVTFALRANAAPTLTYRDLTTHFGEGATPSLMEVYHAVREIRGRKGMVVSEADPDSRSAGSFFKNPVVAETDAPESSPRFPAPEGSVKVPAAWLIEKSGIAKGETLAGGIGISTKHPLALVNQGGATAADVAVAAKLVQQRVFEAFGIMLHPEPLFVGPWDPAKLPEGATTILP